MSELPKLQFASEWLDRNTIRDDAGGTVYLAGTGLVGISVDRYGKHTAFASDALALLDANNLNTTANELRKELAKAHEKLRRVEAVANEMHRYGLSAETECVNANNDCYAAKSDGRSEGFFESENMLRKALNGDCDWLPLEG